MVLDFLPTAGNIMVGLMQSVVSNRFSPLAFELLTFEPEFVYMCVWVTTIARLGLEVKVIGQGQRSMSSAYERGNAVTRSVWPRSSIDDSFSSEDLTRAFSEARTLWNTACTRCLNNVSPLPCHNFDIGCTSTDFNISEKYSTRTRYVCTRIKKHIYTSRVISTIVLKDWTPQCHWQSCRPAP